jgi:glycosyltransferase involved in cell wall biosynthesis
MNKRSNLAITTTERTVVVVTPIDPIVEGGSPTTGLAWYSERWVTALQESGVDVTCWAQRIPTGDVRCAKSVENPRLKVERFWQKGVFSTLQVALQILKKRPSRLHLQFEFNMFGSPVANLLLPLLPLLARLTNTVFTVTMHGGFGKTDLTRAYLDENGVTYPVSFVKSIFSFVFGGLGRFAHHIIVHESWQKDQLLKEYSLRPERVHVIPIGVERKTAMLSRAEARSILGISDSIRVNLFMGFAAPYKGIPDLLDAAEEILAKGCTSLLIVGSAPSPRQSSDPTYMSWYEAQKTRAMNIGPSVRWTGYIPDELLNTYYSAANASVFPYTNRIASSGPMAIALGYGHDLLVSSVFSGDGATKFSLDAKAWKSGVKPLSWGEVGNLTFTAIIEK